MLAVFLLWEVVHHLHILSMVRSKACKEGRTINHAGHHLRRLVLVLVLLVLLIFLVGHPVLELHRRHLCDLPAVGAASYRARCRRPPRRISSTTTTSALSTTTTRSAATTSFLAALCCRRDQRAKLACACNAACL